jgi:hypothetical protein
MAKEIKIKFTIDGIENEVDNLKDFEKAMEKAGKETKKTAEEATIFSDIKDKFNNLTAPIKKVILSMKTLKGAIAATGIGLLIAAFASLIAYFKSSEEGSRKLAIATETLSLLFGKLMEFASGLGASLVSIFENPKQAVKDLGEAVKNNIIERFNSLLEVLGFVGSALKKFFSGDFKGALQDVKEAGTEMVDVFTGVDGTIQKIADTGVRVFNSIKKAVQDAVDTAGKLVDAQRALRNQQQFLIVQNAQLNKELEEQKKIAEDTSLTYEERDKALIKVGETQVKLAKNVEAQAAAEESLLRLQIASANTYEQREELETSLAEAVASRIEAQTALSIVELEAQKLRRELELEELDRKRSIRDILADAAEKDIEDQFDKARRELEIAEAAALEELDMLKANDDEKLALAQSFADKKSAIDEAQADYEMLLQKQVNEANLEQLSSALGAVSGLLGENSKAAKAFAVAQTTIDTYIGAQKAYTSQLVPGDVTSPIRAAVAAGVAVATGIANVRAILKTNPGGAASTPTKPSVPTFNPATYNNEGVGGQTAGDTITLSQQGTQTVVKAYVVASDVTSQQEANKRIDDLTRL